RAPPGDARTLREVDGEGRLGRNAARLVPSAVRTLISRRATHLPEATLAILGDAGVLGRSFSVRDVLAIHEKVGSGEGRAGAGSSAAIAASMRPAVDAGLLLAHPEGDAADYTFTHEQVRRFAPNQPAQQPRRGGA